jgi:hypothetical protein
MSVVSGRQWDCGLVDYTLAAGLGKINRTCVEKIAHARISGKR